MKVLPTGHNDMCDVANIAALSSPLAATASALLTPPTLSNFSTLKITLDYSGKRRRAWPRDEFSCPVE